MAEDRNLRDMKVSTKTPGKLYWETGVCSGEASKTPAESESNETTQYETTMPEKGKLGGKPSHQ
jgi:hypothetical protein